MTQTIRPPDNASPSGVALRLAESAEVFDSALMPTARFHEWLAQRRDAYQFEVNRIRFDQMSGWRTQPDTGNLAHDSGRFFTVEGVRVRTDTHPDGGWSQPIVNQPEVGVLGILIREFNGVLHCLMQAKAEPGNVNAVQLSPTVQATRSNYLGAHRGRPVPYLDLFVGPGHRQVLADVLQSEQGSWFLHKRNRNVVVQTEDEVLLGPDFCWLTVGQIRQLLRCDNLVNMDARTVLSCLPIQAPGPGGDAFRSSLLRSMAAGNQDWRTLTDLISWLTEVRSRHDLAQTPIPLAKVDRWHREPDVMRHEDGRYFEVVAVSVQASAREVGSWTQPLISPLDQAVIAFLVRRIDGVLHALVHARVEAGSATLAELAPTVQCHPGNYVGRPIEYHPPYLDLIQRARTDQIRYDVVQSEEGGRFFQAQTRNLILEVDEDFPAEAPPDYRWVTVWEMTELVRHSNYLNVEARSLLACLYALW